MPTTNLEKCSPHEWAAPQKKEGQPPLKTIGDFFDHIAIRYDFLNQLLSFNLDDRWRKKSRDFILTGEETSILDLGIGTGKFLQCFLEAKHWAKSAGLDYSEAMLKKARSLVTAKTKLLQGDFHHLPFHSGSFDLVISAFTLRSVQHMPAFLKEIDRILADRGQVAFLCLTRPRNLFWRLVSYPYLRFYLPLVGGLLTGRRDAYRFLSDSILTFQEPRQTAQMMEAAGFQKTWIQPWSFGLATLIVGQKRPAA